MNRRAATAAPDTFAAAGDGSGSWVRLLVVAVAFAAVAFGVPVSGVAAASAVAEPVRSGVVRSVEEPESEPVPVATESPIATNDFLPEDRNLTDCIGVLQRPGCGSEARGGWRQTLVFLAVAIGLVVIFGNIARNVRRRNPVATPVERPDVERPSADRPPTE